MLAAGKAIDPFWHLYQQHYASPLPHQLLEEMKIGELDPKDVKVWRFFSSSFFFFLKKEMNKNLEEEEKGVFVFSVVVSLIYSY